MSDKQEYKYIGKAIPVHDAAQKVTGQLRYTDDLKLPNMLHAKVLFSKLPHAKIISLDTSAAESLTGVRAVVSYKNTPRVRYNSTTRFLAQKPLETERVFDDIVRFVGDKVAAVAADTAEIAAKALSLIKVEYEPLLAYFDPEIAMRDDSYPIHEQGNIALTVNECCGDLEKGFAEADHIFTDRYTTQAVHHGAIETHSAIADFNASGQLTVYTPNQNTFGTRISLSKIFDLPMSRVRVISPAIGGGFGGKMEVCLEPIVAALAMQACRPVKLNYTRKESIVSTRTRHAAIVEMKTGIRNDGVITAQHFHVITNTGAYAASAANALGAMSNKVFKLYKTPNMRFSGASVYTNTSIAGAMRGYGSPQAFFAQQRQLQKIADTLGMDIIDIHMKNLIDPDGVDQRSQERIGNPRPKDCLKKALRIASKWPAAESSDGRYKTGQGLSMGMHGSGAFGPQPDQTGIIIKMNDDASCVMMSGSHEMGNGVIIVEMQMVAEVLDIPMSQIRVVAADTDTCPWNLGDFSSRGTYVSAHAAQKAAEAVKQELLKEAALIMEQDSGMLTLKGGNIISNIDGRTVSLSEVVSHAQVKSGREIICNYTFTGKHAPGSYGAHIVRVRIDTESGQVQITNYAAVHDVGCVVNKIGIEGQLEGSIQMGIGYALMEKLDFDEKGQCKASNFRRYKMPKATQMPPIEIAFVEEGEPSGPYGAKSIAESAMIPCAPAIINAIGDALGQDIHDLPYLHF